MKSLGLLVALVVGIFTWLVVTVNGDEQRHTRAAAAYCSARFAIAHSAADTMAALQDTANRYRCEYFLEVTRR